MGTFGTTCIPRFSDNLSLHYLVSSLNINRIQMTVKTIVHEGESLDEALRRWKRSVNKSGVLLECKKRECYLKTGLKRKQKSEMARRKKY